MRYYSYIYKKVLVKSIEIENLLKLAEKKGMCCVFIMICIKKYKSIQLLLFYGAKP